MTIKREPDPLLREQILQRFTQWLDEALADEAPGGLVADLLGEGGTDRGKAPPDLHALFSALTVLAQEVKLQGRTFQQLTESLAREEKERARAREQARRGERELLELLVDLKDRLGRGRLAVSAQLEKLRQQPARWGPWRFLGLSDARVPSLLEASYALAQGYELSLQRLEDALHRLHVEEIACLGRAFDPHQMKAVGALDTAQTPEGQVVDICRPGYLVAGELFRVAEVTVARRPSTPLLNGGAPGE